MGSGRLNGGILTESNANPGVIHAANCCWSLPPAHMVLLKDDVHLWYSSLDLPASCVLQLQSTLDADERERARRICFELERARFVVCRGLLRRILECYSWIESSKLRFVYSSRGKPALRERVRGHKIQFNLSHSSGRAIYAVTLDREVGVDLERVVPLVESEQIANRFFSNREKASVRALAGIRKHEAFFKAWTAKEAYLKACGKGLAYALDKIEVPKDCGHFHPISGDSKNGSQWSLKWLSPESAFTAALVVEGKSNYRLACWQFLSRNLMRK